MPTLGEELRQARESRSISLRQIADATHIGIRFLQAIEQDNYKILPGGIFNRAFVKSFARYVGLDEEHALAAYQQQLEASGGEPPRAPTPKFEGLEEEPTSSWSSTLLAMLAILILGLGGWGLWYYFTQQKPAVEEKKEPVSTTPTPGSLPVQQVSPTPTPDATPGASVSPTANPAAGVSPSPAAAPIPEGALAVRIQARDSDCWVKVKPDGTEVARVGWLLKPGDAAREITFTNELIVNVGNVATLDMTINGRPVKITPNKGKVSAEGIRITKENLAQFYQ